MKPVSKSLFAATIALTVGALYSPAQAEIRWTSEFPAQKEIDVRKVVADQPLNHRGYFVAFEASKIDAVVMFKSGTDKLTKEGEAEVARAASLIKSTSKHVIVEGNTDSSGKAAKNQDLSYRRALRVTALLVRKYGIPASQLTAKGYGSSMPAATNSTAAGRAANRRVTFSIGEAGNS